jgi:predicted anti-sigma-YlaC factor YlaD
MDCDLARELLEDQAAGRLDSRQAEEFGAHLRGCASCARELRWTLALKASVRGLPRPAMPPELRSELLRAAQAPRSRGFLAWLDRPWKAAAGLGLAAACAAAGVLLVVRTPQESLSLDEMLAEHERYQATMPAADREAAYSGLATEEP